MSALARFFKQRGDNVCGYDRTASPLTKQLEAEGIAIHYVDDPKQIPDDIDLVIYTPAVPHETNEFQALLQRGVPMEKRSQILGELTRGKRCVAVAGSHGKTTTSAMIAYLLSNGTKGCSAFLGGISKNFDSNLLVNADSPWVVVEADEYDRSFLQLHPYYSVITATDPDHLDIYGTHRNLLEAFAQFANQTDREGQLFIKDGIGFEDANEETAGHGKHFTGKAMVGGKDITELRHSDKTVKEDVKTSAALSQSANSEDSIKVSRHAFHETVHNAHPHSHGEEEKEHYGLSLAKDLKVETYTARSIDADYYAINVRHYGASIYFDMRTPQGVLYDMQLTNSSLYNVENATVATAVAFACGLDEHQVRYGLKTFAGIKRRFEYRINEPYMVYIDDYAHHPREIAACIESVKYLYPDKRIVGVFQPHLYSRTADLYKEFAEALSPLDEIVLMDIYPAREKAIPGVTSRLILNEIKSMNRYIVPRNEVPQMCVALCPDVVISMGAGDIDREVPKIEAALRESL